MAKKRTTSVGREATARAKFTPHRSNGVYGALWHEARNQAKWRGRWEDSAHFGARSNEQVNLLYAQGKTRYNQQRISAPFVPPPAQPEPTLEWVVSRIFPGLRGLLLETHAMMDMWHIVVNAGAPHDNAARTGKAERTVTEERRIAVCGDIGGELLGLDSTGSAPQTQGVHSVASPLAMFGPVTLSTTTSGRSRLTTCRAASRFPPPPCVSSPRPGARLPCLKPFPRLADLPAARMPQPPRLPDDVHRARGPSACPL